MDMLRPYHSFCITLLVLVSACSSQPEPACLYTHVQASGNRYIKGISTFPNVRSYSIAPPDKSNKIDWLLGIHTKDENMYWYASDARCSGRECDTKQVYSFVHLRNNSEGPVYVGNFHIPGILFLPPYQITIPDETSRMTHPVCLDSDHFAYVSEKGDVILNTALGRSLARRKLNALPDARLVLNEQRTRLAVLCGANKRKHPHGLLGDEWEATQIKILNTNDLSDIATINTQSNISVFESLSPMFADLDNDGVEELIVTESDIDGGASIMVYSQNGYFLGRSDPVGTPLRWRHQIAVGPFGPGGETELAVCQTPHAGFLAEFFSYTPEKKLNRVASRHGYSSHILGSRNLDMAVAGDFNGDGQVELVLPSKSRRRLVGLQRNNGTTREPLGTGVEEAWSIWMGEKIVSNLAPMKLPDGELALGLALANGTIVVLMPDHNPSRAYTF